MARQGWGRHSTVATGSDSGDQVSVNAWNADTNKAGMLGFTGETIASATSITPTSTTLILSGSTNVSTIATTNTSEYDLLYIFTSGTVTLVNTSSPSSAGDIKLLANANTDLSQSVPTILIRKGNFWYEYGGSPVTDASITFAKIQNLATMKVIGRTAASTGVSSEVAILDEDNMASDSAVSLATQQSIKAYVDAQSHSTVTPTSTTTFENKSIDLTDNTLTGTSAELKTAISDETGSGSLVFATSPTLVTPALGTPASGILTNCTFPTLNQNTTGSSGSTTGNAATATTSTNITVADESTDTSCNVLFTTAATGALPPKSGTNLTFNSNTGILTATGFAGPLTGNVTGNASGTAATVTGAAQTAITSVGTLTALAVDNITIDANKIEATNTNGNIQLDSNGTGVIEVLGNTNDGAITLNCTANTHGQTIKSQPHSASATNTMLLPLGANSTLVSLVSTDTLTNKTLTAPVINAGSDADGDVYYRASGAFTRLAKGTAGQVLTINTGATAPEWATSSGGASTLLDFKYQAVGYTTPSYTARTVNDSSTPIQLWVKDIDTNNQGIYIRIKKNAAYTDVQIA